MEVVKCNDAIFLWWCHLHQHFTSEDIIAAFTVVLALSTIFLWKATNRTANIAEKALEDAERPQIFINVIDPGFEINPDNLQISLPSRQRFKFQLINYGKSAARITELFAIWDIGAGKTAMPYDIDPIKQRGIKLPIGSVAGDNKPYEERRNIKDFCDVQKLMANNFLNENRFFFLGHVRYIDIFEKEYITGFCTVLDPESKSFNLIGDQRYNYTRKEGQIGFFKKFLKKVL